MSFDFIDSFSTEDLRFPPSPLQAFWMIPDEIKIEGEYLVWNAEFSSGIRPTQEIMRGMVDHFIKLGRATDKQILMFAQYYGVLGIGSPDAINEKHELLPRKSGIYYEYLNDWRYYANQAELVLKIADALHRGELLDPKQWKESVSGWPNSRDHYKYIVCSIMNSWFQQAKVKPFFRWEDKPSLLLVSDRTEIKLLSVLAIQIMLMAYSSPGLSICPGCGNPFLLRKGQPGPSSSRNAFCEGGCGTGAAVQQAVKRYRYKERTSPNREKRKQKIADRKAETIRHNLEAARQRNKPLRPLVQKLAEKHGVSESMIYKIADDKYWGKRLKAIRKREKELLKQVAMRKKGKRK
jgi:hypothetical protein